MGYRQYTKCASISGFVGFKWVQYVMAGGTLVVAGMLAFLLGAAFVPGAAIAALSAVIAYCLWWLYDRLICLGGDVCAVGYVLSVETPDEKSGLDRFDTDYSLNLVLAPTGVGIQQKALESSLQGDLVKETQDVRNYSFLGYHLPFSGNLVEKFADPNSYPPYSGFYKTACLHAEFEGGGTYDLLQACYAALALATAAAVACAIPVIGWVACLILSVAAGLVTLAGVINALNDTGNPTDVNSNMTSVHAAEEPDGYGADVLVVRGTWVYDSAHEGWNEIHPIKQCQRIGSLIGQGWAAIDVGDTKHPAIQDIPDMKKFVDTWCGMLVAAVDPGTVAGQQLPQNGWIIHPLIDGCQPAGAPPPPLR